jgi:hypothetical protein
MATETELTVIDHDALTGVSIERPATSDEIKQREIDIAEHSQREKP